MSQNVIIKIKENVKERKCNNNILHDLFWKKKCHNHNNIKLNIEQAKNST